MAAPLLLDTCAAIWIAAMQPLSDQARAAMRNAFQAGQPIYVSPITAWEVGLLAARGRVNLLTPPLRWFKRFLQTPGVMQAEMSADVLVASSFLPGSPPSDPADRIIAATAREFGYVLVTRDRPLLTYADLGHMQAIVC
jgi:PIN domain nuclease of toxin-antitoxin system